MYITDEQIHPQLRKQGVFIRKHFRFTDANSFISAQNKLELVKKMMRPKGFKVEKVTIRTEDNPHLNLIIARSKHAQPNACGLLWLHGGGFAIGTPEQDYVYMEKFLSAANCVIVAPDYRLSVNEPYPAALEDSYETLVWMKKNAAALGIRSDQLFVAGDSAGGGLTAAVSLLARDLGKVNIAFQMPFYPMLDDRMITPSSQDNNAPIWDSQANRVAWGLYLKALEEEVPAYAAPVRATDFHGLPPTYSFVGTIEPFYNETKIYIRNLQEAGIPATLDEYDGAFHAFDLICSNTAIAKKASLRYLAAFIYATENYFAPQD